MTNFKRFSELATRFMASLRPKQNKTTTTTTEEGVIRMSVSVRVWWWGKRAGQGARPNLVEKMKAKICPSRSLCKRRISPNV